MLVRKTSVLYARHSDIIKNIFFLCIEKIFFFAMVFYAEAIISRTLGAESYGKWLYSVNIILVVSSFTLVAGAEIIVPALSRNRKLQWHILTSAFIVRMIFSTLAFLGVYSYIIFFVQDKTLQLMLCSLSIVLLTLEPFGVIINYYQSRIKAGYAVFARLLGLFIRCGVVSLAIWLSHYDLIYFCRGAEALFLSAILLIFIFREGYTWSFSSRVLLNIFSRGIRLWIPLVLMYIYMRSDRFFVEYYLGYKELANYGIAAQIIEQLVLLISIVIQSIGPKFIFSRNSLNRTKVIFIVLLIVIPVQVVASVLLPYFVLKVFGEQYINSGAMAVNMLPAVLFYAIDMVYMQYIYRDGRYGVVFIKWVSMLFVSSVSYYMWLSVFGKSSVEVVFVINYFLMLLITIFIFHFIKKHS